MNSRFLSSTADEFLICYAARDWLVSLLSVSRYGSTKEKKYWFEYEENLLHRAYFGYGSISEMWRKKFQKLSMLLSIWLLERMDRMAKRVLIAKVSERGGGVRGRPRVG